MRSGPSSERGSAREARGGRASSEWPGRRHATIHSAEVVGGGSGAGTPMSESTALAPESAAPLPGPLAEFWRSYSQSRGALAGLALIVILLLFAAFADVISPHPPNEQYRQFTLSPPIWDAGGTREFILGTDPVGRDMLSR